MKWLIVFSLLLISVSLSRAQDEELIEEEEVFIADTVTPLGGDGVPGGEVEIIEEEKKPVITDPCLEVECGSGKDCIVDETGKGVCKCAQNCRVKASGGPRFQICSNQNETFNNLCEMEREKCMCDSGEKGCMKATHKTVELKHYGSCRGPLVCLDTNLEEFPYRIRVWLRLVLFSLASRHTLSRSEVMMARESATLDNAHITPVLWKFCNLDNDPSDGLISVRELLPLVAQLYPLENCAAKFFMSCDTDGSKDLSLKEFGTCCGLTESNIKNRCGEIELDEELTEGPEPGFLIDES